MTDIDLYCPSCNNNQVGINKWHEFRGSAKISEIIEIDCDKCGFNAGYSHEYIATT